MLVEPIVAKRWCSGRSPIVPSPSPAAG